MLSSLKKKNMDNISNKHIQADIFLLDVSDFLKTLRDIEKECEVEIDETAVLEYLFYTVRYEATATEDLESSIISIPTIDEFIDTAWWIKDDVVLPISVLDACLTFGKELIQLLKDLKVYSNGVLETVHLGTLDNRLAVLFKDYLPYDPHDHF